MVILLDRVGGLKPFHRRALLDPMHPFDSKLLDECWFRYIVTTNRIYDPRKGFCINTHLDISGESVDSDVESSGEIAFDSITEYLKVGDRCFDNFYRLPEHGTHGVLVYIIPAKRPDGTAYTNGDEFKDAEIICYEGNSLVTGPYTLRSRLKPVEELKVSPAVGAASILPVTTAKLEETNTASNNAETPMVKKAPKKCRKEAASKKPTKQQQPAPLSPKQKRRKVAIAEADDDMVIMDHGPIDYHFDPPALKQSTKSAQLVSAKNDLKVAPTFNQTFTAAERDPYLPNVFNISVNCTQPESTVGESSTKRKEVNQSDVHNGDYGIDYFLEKVNFYTFASNLGHQEEFSRFNPDERDLFIQKMRMEATVTVKRNGTLSFTRLNHDEVANNNLDTQISKKAKYPKEELAKVVWTNFSLDDYLNNVMEARDKLEAADGNTFTEEVIRLKELHKDTHRIVVDPDRKSYFHAYLIYKPTVPVKNNEAAITNHQIPSMTGTSGSGFSTSQMQFPSQQVPAQHVQAFASLPFPGNYGYTSQCQMLTPSAEFHQAANFNLQQQNNFQQQQQSSLLHYNNKSQPLLFDAARTYIAQMAGQNIPNLSPSNGNNMFQQHLLSPSMMNPMVSHVPGFYVNRYQTPQQNAQFFSPHHSYNNTTFQQYSMSSPAMMGNQNHNNISYYGHPQQHQQQQQQTASFFTPRNVNSVQGQQHPIMSSPAMMGNHQNHNQTTNHPSLQFLNDPNRDQSPSHVQHNLEQPQPPTTS